MEEDGTFDLLPKKEVVGLKKEYDKLNKLLCGIRDMDKLPQAMFIVDPMKEEIAIREAKKLNIPVFGIVDTNCDPDMVDYVIPGNDDGIRAVKLVMGVIANAIAEANGNPTVDYVSGKNDDGKDIMKRAVESVKRKEDRPKFNNTNNFNNKDKKFDKKKSLKKVEKAEKEDKEETKTEEVKAEVKEQPKEKKEEKVAVKEKATDLSDKTVSELRELAKAKEIKGYSTMKKAELLEALK